MTKDFISIIVPTYNKERQKDLFEFLDSASKQTYQYLEIIVVVEKSKEYYTAILEYVKTFTVPVKVIFSSGLQGISFSRNLGISYSKGTLIAITDDDALLPKEWAAILVDTYNAHPEAIGVTGNAIPYWINPEDSWFPESVYWVIGCTAFRNWIGEQKTNITSGVNMSFRRVAFEFATFPNALGAGANSQGKLGFPNEDNDYALQITSITGRPIIFNPSLRVKHKVYPNRLSAMYIRKYSFWQGCAESRYSETWYSRGKRESLRRNIVKNFSIDITKSLFSKPKIGLRKIKVLTLLLCFLSLGYISYKLKIHGYFSRLL